MKVHGAVWSGCDGRLAWIWCALALTACGPRSTTEKPELAVVATPVGLFGTWIEAGGRADTLALRPDSTASGWNRRPDQPAVMVSRWAVRFLSKDPVSSRSDWLGHRFQDGGDLTCTVKPDSTCVSAPVLCLGDDDALDCMGFRYQRDSLALSNGMRYVRAVDTESSTP